MELEFFLVNAIMVFLVLEGPLVKSDDVMFPEQILRSELHSESLYSEAVGVQCCISLVCEEHFAGTSIRP